MPLHLKKASAFVRELCGIVDVVKKGQHVSFKVPARIRPSDKLYRMVPSEELKAK